MTDKAREALDAWAKADEETRRCIEALPQWVDGMPGAGVVEASVALDEIGEHAAAGEYLTKAEVNAAIAKLVRLAQEEQANRDYVLDEEMDAYLGALGDVGQMLKLQEHINKTGGIMTTQPTSWKVARPDVPKPQR